MQERNHPDGPVRGETRAKQAGGPRLTLWVLIGSLILAVGVGAMMLTNTDEVPPSTTRAVEDAPNAGAAPTAPATEAQPDTQPASPPTNQ